MSFDRAISKTFIAHLAEESTRIGWWRDVLDDPTLFIAPRGNTLTVYWLGQALFNVSFSNGMLSVSTHEKYLIDPALERQVSLVDGRFDTAASLERALVEKYDGPDTLRKMKRAAALYSGDEKRGCHEVAVHNANVLDVEIAFPGLFALADGREKSAPRVDLASVEANNGNVHLVFWEAKLYTNGDLRSLAEGLPLVCRQVQEYRSAIDRHGPDIEASYTTVAANLVEFKKMGWARKLSRLIESVGSGEERLSLGRPPKVGLVIFNFDSGQRDEPRWQQHLSKLQSAIGDVRAVGAPKKIRL